MKKLIFTTFSLITIPALAQNTTQPPATTAGAADQKSLSTRAEKFCQYNCVTLGLTYLRPTREAGELLRSGSEIAIWYRPEAFRALDDAIFRKLDIPVWRDMQFNTGVYYNKFTGPDYDRRYISTGASLGILWQSSLTEKHELFAQGDMRFGGAYAHRTGADSSSANVQPAIAGGLQMRLPRGSIGIAAQSLVSSDNSPLVAFGASLRLSIALGASDRVFTPEATPPQVVSTPVIQQPVPLVHQPAPVAGTNVESLPDGANITLPVSRVSFAVGKSSLDANGKKYMSGLARILGAADRDWKKFDIYGHTDSRGSEALNRALSKKRADTVANELKAAGVQPNKIATQGKGSSEVIDRANTDTAHANNRRVVIRVNGDQNGDQIARQIMDYENKFSKAGTP